jgi:hypothetical protein
MPPPAYTAKDGSVWKGLMSNFTLISVPLILYFKD